jgi:hypothetical protein
VLPLLGRQRPGLLYLLVFAAADVPANRLAMTYAEQPGLQSSFGLHAFLRSTTRESKRRHRVHGSFMTETLRGSVPSHPS